MLIHICCSVDSWYFLSKIREKFTEERLKGYFYNPNIHPRGEYLARMIDARRSCDRLGIEFIEGEYDFGEWIGAASGLECEPEKGERCAVCFDFRLEKTAKLARDLGDRRFTTTLLTSPKKDFAQLKTAAEAIAAKYDLEFVFEDFRKGGGTQAAFALAREKGAYFQDYCGCVWGLIKQRAAQGRFADELSSPIDGSLTAAERRAKAIEERDAEEINGRFFVPCSDFSAIAALESLSARLHTPKYAPFAPRVGFPYASSERRKLWGPYSALLSPKIPSQALKKTNAIRRGKACLARQPQFIAAVNKGRCSQRPYGFRSLPIVFRARQALPLQNMSEIKTIGLVKRRSMSWRLLGGMIAGEDKIAIASEIAPYSASCKIRSRLIATDRDGVFRFEKSAGFVIERETIAACKGVDSTRSEVVPLRFSTSPLRRVESNGSPRNDGLSAIAEGEILRYAQNDKNTQGGGLRDIAAIAREILDLPPFDITPIFVVDRVPIGVATASIESVFFEEDALESEFLAPLK